MAPVATSQNAAIQMPNQAPLYHGLESVSVGIGVGVGVRVVVEVGVDSSVGRPVGDMVALGFGVGVGVDV